MNSPNQSQPYDWGVPSQPANGPAQQPAGNGAPPPQGPQGPHGGPGPQGPVGGQPPQGQQDKPRKNLKPWAFTALAVVVIAALVYAGLWIYQSTRGTEKGPLGWDNEQIAKHVSKNKLADCDLGEEFWNSVGLKDVQVSGDEETCQGWYETADGGEVLVTMEIDSSSSGVSVPDDSVSLSSDGLRGWTAQEKSEDGYLSTEPTEKCTYYSKSGLFVGTLSTPATCGALKPLASQLTNLDIQDREATASKDLTDFDSPEDLPVNVEPVEVSSPRWEKLGKHVAKTGEAQKVRDDGYSGSKITVDKIDVDKAQVCADATFRLGRETDRFAFQFHVPDMRVVFPTGSALKLDRDPERLRLKEGATKKLSYCGDLEDAEYVGYRGGQAYLVSDLDSSGDLEGSAWKFDLATQD